MRKRRHSCWNVLESRKQSPRSRLAHAEGCSRERSNPKGCVYPLHNKASKRQMRAPRGWQSLPDGVGATCGEADLWGSFNCERSCQNRYCKAVNWQWSSMSCERGASCKGFGRPANPAPTTMNCVCLETTTLRADSSGWVGRPLPSFFDTPAAPCDGEHLPDASLCLVRLRPCLAPVP